ncbi:MAG: hypothetical protein IIW10_01570, partial [Spirochaetaceae bacterium]|nr:hypothetical protein [Spirochaetaceae bacterium]
YFSVMKVYSFAWVTRTVAIMVMLPIPFFYAQGNKSIGIFFIMLSSLLFNVARGVGMIANNPVLNDLAPGKDRGSFIVRIALINNLWAFIATLSVTVFLILMPQIVAFNIAVVVAIVMSTLACISLFKMPDFGKPVKNSEGKRQSTFIKNFAEALSDSNFIVFVIVFSLISFAVGMAKPFIIVYCRDVYSLSDKMVSVVSLFATLGSLLMGFATRIFIDRIGPKPVYVFFAILSVIAMIPPILSLKFSFFAPCLVFLCAFSLFAFFGFSGQENAGQTYFFSLVKSSALLDLSIVYYAIWGVTGSVGSVFGGVLIDGFLQSNFSTAGSYRLFFSILAIFIIIAVVIMSRLKRLNSFSLSTALPLFFSPRDIKAFNLLYRLDRTGDADEQEKLLGQLAGTNTAAADEEIVQLLRSPQCSVRLRALETLQTIPALSEMLVEMLISELKTGKYTSAAVAASILGKFKVRSAVNALRECVDSDDYMLAAESILSLARIGDDKSQLECAEIATKTKNPHILLWTVRAMRIYGNLASMPVLQNLLRTERDIDSVENEIILAFAKILGIHKIFYKPFSDFCENRQRGESILLDFFESHKNKSRNKNLTLPPQILNFYVDHSNSEDFVSVVLKIKNGKSLSESFLLQSIVDTDLTSIQSYRFFIVFCVIQILITGKPLGTDDN